MGTVTFLPFEKLHVQPKVLDNVSEECGCNEKDDNVLAKEKKITLELSEMFHNIERAKIRFWKPIYSD